MTDAGLASSRDYCRRVTRRAGSSFPLAFRVLPRPKRDAMLALYAYFRLTDDLADGPGELAGKRERLARWRADLAAALPTGVGTHRVHPALAAAVTTFGVPARHLFDVLDGVEMDLEPVAFRSFTDLYPYCYRVASAVGLACVPVWGLKPGRESAALAPAEAAGVAFQLTNILRDVAEDQSRGRVYLPADDLARFDLSPANWQTTGKRSAFRAMMHHQTTRARDYYDRGRELDALLTPDGRAIFSAMTRLYRGLLDRIAAADYDVFAGRVRVPAGVKLAAVARAWPVRWGLA